MSSTEYEKCLEKAKELRRLMPTLQAAIDKHMDSTDRDLKQRQRLEKLTGLYEVLARPEQHRLTMALLVKAEALLKAFEKQDKDVSCGIGYFLMF